MSDNDDPLYGGDLRMRDVLLQRKREYNAQDKGTRERAEKTRAKLQALCAECRCTWPVEKHATESEHAEWCPAHGQWLSWREVEARR